MFVGVDIDVPQNQHTLAASGPTKSAASRRAALRNSSEPKTRKIPIPTMGQAMPAIVSKYPVASEMKTERTKIPMPATSIQATATVPA